MLAVYLLHIFLKPSCWWPLQDCYPGDVFVIEAAFCIPFIKFDNEIWSTRANRATGVDCVDCFCYFLLFAQFEYRDDRTHTHTHSRTGLTEVDTESSFNCASTARHDYWTWQVKGVVPDGCGPGKLIYVNLPRKGQNQSTKPALSAQRGITSKLLHWLGCKLQDSLS